MSRLLQYFRTERPIHAKQTAQSANILNKKANAKLDLVLHVFEQALDTRWHTEYNTLLHKKATLFGFRYLKEIELRYTLQNRLFATIYNFIISYKVPSSYNEYMKFELRYSGKSKISAANFLVLQGEEEADPIQERLSNPLITDRLRKLDFLDLIIEYLPNEQNWRIKVDSLIGSSTWNFIPPVFQVIKPNIQECILMIELFELIAHALQNQAE